MRGEGDDNLTWKLTPSGVFEVRSYYLFLYGSLTDDFPWESIQCVNVPKRVSFFLWEAAWDGILTIDNLVKRGWSFINRCCLCRCEGEYVDRLLLLIILLMLCRVKFFGVRDPMGDARVLFAWRYQFRKYRSNIWIMVSGCLIWLVQQELFEDKEKCQ